MALVYERPDADIIDGEWRDEAQGQTLFDNLDETATESSLLQPAVLLHHYDGTDGSTTITDSSASAHTFTCVNQAQLDTAQFKFGTASLLLDGTDDYLNGDGSSDFAFGTGDFTVDCWIRLNAVGAFQMIYAAPTLALYNGSFPQLLVRNDNFIAMVSQGGYQIIGTTALTTGIWYHVALVKYKSSTKLYLNGAQEGSTLVDTDNYSNDTNGPRIGANYTVSDDFNGWIDELRVVKGEALWTTNFQPPTSPSTPATRDYIISSPNPANDMCRIRLSDQSATTPAMVRYQYSRRGQIETDLTVRLKQGSTVIQEWFHADIREGLYTASQLLDTSAFALITDASDLSMEFEANEPWWL